MERTIRIMRAGVFTTFLLSVVLLNQFWVGAATIYGAKAAPKRLMTHQAILANQLPEGESWSRRGSNGSNVRIAVVYAAEAIHVATGLGILKVYRAIDLVTLFVSLLLIYRFFRSFVGEPSALLGLAYLAAILPLTYVLHAFHPWDRPSLVCWVFMLLLLRRGHVAAFALVYFFTITVKFDCLFLPALVLVVDGPRWTPRRRVATAVALMALGFAEFQTLVWFLPGGFDAEGDSVALVVGQLVRNWEAFKEQHVAYPPMLGFAAPAMLMTIGLSRSDRFARACALLGVLLLIGPYFLRTNFAELRAEMPCLLLLMPSSLRGLELLLESRSDSEINVEEKGRQEFHIRDCPTKVASDMEGG